MADGVTSSIGIVGSGIMAAGIAEVAARGDVRAIIRARSEASVASALKQISGGLARQVDKGKLEAAERDRILANISTTTDLAGLTDCDIIIESVVEDLDTKQALFRELDAIAKPSAILATNTSTLAVVEMLARILSRSETSSLPLSTCRASPPEICLSADATEA